MNSPYFDWDKHFSTESFSFIQSLSPELSSRRFPSSYSPDKKLYFVSPFDVTVQIDNVESLKNMLSALGEDFHSCTDDDYSRRYLVYVDFTQICLMLLDLEGAETNYGIPDEVLMSRNYHQKEEG